MRGGAMWRWARLAAAAGILAVLVWRLGTGPFRDGVRAVDGWSLVAATALAVPATVCCAWRWRVVARGLGVDLPLRTAVAACYRSVFLNVALPGGIVGDVHRGFRHGRHSGDVGRGLRSVVWERGAGQLVQVVLTVAVLLVAPSPVRGAMPVVAVVLLAGTGALLLAARAVPRDGRSRPARALAVARTDVRLGLLAGGAWVGVAVTSAVVVACHTATFMLAARTAGTPAPAVTTLPLALLVMAAMALPNVGGWGPREGVAAWAFGAAGLGADRGLATAVAFGVMVFVAALPGAVVLAVEWMGGTPAGGLAPASVAPDGVADA
ncbi:MAG: lysylphosphatidylglycerol synthase transmembrane domain-containing protein [Thermoleophilia bacterium]